jgi:ABC-2 type transport system ATP-binding protein
MVAGRIDALGTPAELKQAFGVRSIDELFVRLARPADDPAAEAGT